MLEATQAFATTREAEGRSKVIPASKDFAELTPRLLSFRKPLYHPGFPFVILWSQKAGCTTVVKWFFLQLGLLEEALRFHPWIHQYEGNIFKKRPEYIDDLYDAIKGGIPVIKFVRDPYTRAYSSYLSVCHSKAIGADRHWSLRTRERIVQDLVGDKSALEYAFSFRQFLAWLSQQRDQTVDPHIRLQHVPRDDYLNIRFCKIESLTDNFRSLEQEFGLPHSATEHPEIFESGHFHKKREFDRHTARALLDVGVPVQRSDNFPHVSFTRDLADGTEYRGLVQQCFQLDLELYDYLGEVPENDDERWKRRARRAHREVRGTSADIGSGRREEFL